MTITIVRIATKETVAIFNGNPKYTKKLAASWMQRYNRSGEVEYFITISWDKSVNEEDRKK